jgi:hypothetical protein
MIQTIIDPMVAEAMQLTCSSPSLSCLYVLFIILAYVSFLNPPPPAAPSFPRLFFSNSLSFFTLPLPYSSFLSLH